MQHYRLIVDSCACPIMMPPGWDSWLYQGTYVKEKLPLIIDCVSVFFFAFSESASIWSNRIGLTSTHSFIHSFIRGTPRLVHKPQLVFIGPDTYHTYLAGRPFPCKRRPLVIK